MRLDQLQEKILNQIEQAEATQGAIREAARQYADAEVNYRQAKAVARLSIETDGTRRTVAHVDAMVDEKVRTEMLRAKLAEADYFALREVAQTQRAALSALQTLVRLEVGEIEMGRYQGRTQGEAYAGAHGAPV